MNNIDFIYDIMKYIKESFSNDSDFSNVKIEKAYKPENQIKTPEIDIFLDNDIEDVISNSYDKENISIKVVTFYCYNKAMEFNNSETKSDVVDSTMILSDRLKAILNKNLVAKNNKNIISLTRKNSIPPQNVRDGMVYVAIIRYEFKVLNEYAKIYNR